MNNYISIMVLALEVGKYQRASVFFFFTYDYAFSPVRNTQKRFRHHKKRREFQGEGERARTERTERSLTARLQHYLTTGYPRGSSNFESTSTRLCLSLSLSYAVVPFTSSLLIYPSLKFFSQFFRSCSTKNFVEVRKDDAFGNRKLHRHVRALTWHCTFPPRLSDCESNGQRGKAEGNAQFATYGTHWYSP